MGASRATATTSRPDLPGLLCLGAAALAAVATAVSSLGGDHDLVPFFAALTLAGGIAAWAVQQPGSPTRRIVARVLGLAWIVGAVWIGGLLVWYQVACGCSSPEPIAPDPTFAGLPAAAFHLAATYVGGAFVAVATLGRAGRPTDREADAG